MEAQDIQIIGDQHGSKGQAVWLHTLNHKLHNTKGKVNILDNNICPMILSSFTATNDKSGTNILWLRST